MPVKEKLGWTWGEFKELPKEGLDFILDTTALNKKYEDSKDNPYRWRVGTFQVPKYVNGDHMKNLCKSAIDKWLEIYERQGWQLASKVQVYRGNPFGYDLHSGVALLDREELRVRAIFKNINQPKTMRIEIPQPSTNTLQDAMKAYGVRAVPRNKRPQNN